MNREDLLKMIPEGWEECTVDEYDRAHFGDALYLMGREPLYARKKPEKSKKRRSVTFDSVVVEPFMRSILYVRLGNQGQVYGLKQDTPVKVTLEWEE